MDIQPNLDLGLKGEAKLSDLTNWLLKRKKIFFGLLTGRTARKDYSAWKKLGFTNEAAVRLMAECFNFEIPNTIAIFREAENFGADVVSTDLDQTWRNFFVKSSSHVSERDLQQLWAVILKSEIDQKGSISLGTLQKLSVFGKNDAKMLLNIVPYTVFAEEKAFLPQELVEVSSTEIDYEKVLYLASLGIVHLDKARFTSAQTNQILQVGVVRKRIEKVKVNLQVYPFTQAGYQLVNFLLKQSFEEVDGKKDESEKIFRFLDQK